jgi:hypothetical protein
VEVKASYTRSTAGAQTVLSEEGKRWSVKVRDLSGPDRTPLVGHAVAKISLQMDCPVDEALTLLRALTRLRRESMQETAASVVEGSVSFDE